MDSYSVFLGLEIVYLVKITGCDLFSSQYKQHTAHDTAVEGTRAATNKGFYY